MNSFGKNTLGQGFASSKHDSEAITFNNQGGKKGRGRFKYSKGNKTSARFRYLTKIQKIFNKIRGINTATSNNSRSSGPTRPVVRGHPQDD